MATQRVQTVESERTAADPGPMAKYAPQQLTVWQTVVLTAKVFAGGAVILALLWFLDKATS